MWELVGYAGMGLTILAFTLKDILKLRIISLIACLIWIAYALHINDMPITILNIVIILIHIYHIIKNKNGNKNWEKGNYSTNF